MADFPVIAAHFRNVRKKLGFLGVFLLVAQKDTFPSDIPNAFQSKMRHRWMYLMLPSVQGRPISPQIIFFLTHSAALFYSIHSHRKF